MGTVTGTFETVASPPTETTGTVTGTFETTSATAPTTGTVSGTFETTTGTSYTTGTVTGTFETASAGGVYRFNGTQWIKQLVYRFVNGAWRQL